jgi:hypothetical protein
MIIEAIEAYAKGHIAKHKANVHIYLKNPVGIGEHSDVLEAIEIELDQINPELVMKLVRQYNEYFN